MPGARWEPHISRADPPAHPCRHHRIYTATPAKFAVISVTADLTVWTDGHQLWCNCQGQRHTWPTADPAAAAAGIAALARP